MKKKKVETTKADSFNVFVITCCQLKRAMCSSPTYPTVVMVTKDHHIPSREPQIKDFGKSTWFHFISCKRENRYNWLEKNVLRHLTTTKRTIRPSKRKETLAKSSLVSEGLRYHSLFYDH